ncbi:MAG: hypothetical protein PHP98_06275, partial [Kiritimatiellae bacterium]|nr:hypothetical protein [Kiritimatiellia bacterium]
MQIFAGTGKSFPRSLATTPHNHEKNRQQYVLCQILFALKLQEGVGQISPGGKGAGQAPPWRYAQASAPRSSPYMVLADMAALNRIRTRI